MPARSDVAVDNPVPTPPFWGTRVVKGIALADYAAYLDERATFLGQWGLKPGRGEDGQSYEELVETEGRPRLRMWLDRIQTERLLEAAVVYGYFPCVGEGDDLVVLHHEGELAGRSGPGSPSPASAATGTCACRTSSGRATAARPTSSPSRRHDGRARREATAKLFEANAYRDYLELHGLSVQLAEALAENWHARVRAELGFAREDNDDMDDIFAAGLPRLPVLLRLPRLPRPRGPVPSSRPCSSPSGSGSSSPRGSSSTPSSPRRRDSCTTPRPSTSTPPDAADLEDAGLGAVGRERPSRRRPAGDPVRRPGREARQPRLAGRSQSTGGRASRPRAALGVEIEDPLRPGPVSSVPAPGGPVELE